MAFQGKVTKASGDPHYGEYPYINAVAPAITVQSRRIRCTSNSVVGSDRKQCSISSWKVTPGGHSIRKQNFCSACIPTKHTGTRDQIWAVIS